MREGFIQRWPNTMGRRRTPTVQGAAAAEQRHDALQSMATISALLAAGAETVSDPQLTRRRLHQIESEVQALRDLVRGADAPMPTQVVDIAAEVREIVNSLSVDFPGVIGVIAGDRAPARVTGTALRRVLANLLRNAMRAAGGDGQVLVTVAWRVHDVLIAVDDDGPGLGALPVVHGLGLRSVRRLVEEADGTVRAYAHGRLGGASIQVVLPAARSEMAS